MFTHMDIFPAQEAPRSQQPNILITAGKPFPGTAQANSADKHGKSIA